MNTPTLFELALVHSFESGHYTQAKFSLLSLSRSVSGQNADDLIFIREFINYRLFIENPDLSDLDNHYVNSTKKSDKNESTLCHGQSQKNDSIDKTINSLPEEIQKKIDLNCSTCFIGNNDNCGLTNLYCPNEEIIKEYEKEQGGSPSKTNNQESFVGLSDSLSPPYFEHIIILGVQ